MSKEDNNQDSDNKVEEVTKTISHGLEDFFGLPKGSTELTVKEYVSDLKRAEEYDDKDHEIESQFKEIYDKAMSGYLNLNEMVQNCPPNIKARLAEVALQHLNTALTSTQSKLKQKEHRDKMEVKKTQRPGGKVTNNILVTDRNTLLRKLMGGNDPEEEPIDVEEVEEVKDEHRD